MKTLNVINVWLLLLSGAFCGAQEVKSLNTSPHQVPSFELDDFLGRTYSLDEVNTPALVIAFLGTECPLARLYSIRLNEIVATFPEQVTVWAVNANRQDSLTELAAFAKRQGLQYPLLKDERAAVADLLHAERTPEVFLLDQNRRVRYQGRFDDQYGVGYARAQPTRNDLRIAIQELLDGKEVTVPKTAAVGCIIGRPQRRPPTGNLTYSEHIAPILQEHCVECHRDGQVAPFALTEFDEVVGWADTIREVVQDQRMPPWHADPRYGTFANARSMPDADQATLFQWIENGMPRGRPVEPLLPPKHAKGGALTESDFVAPMAAEPFSVPAEGTVDYQYFVVDPEFTEDKWVAAAEVMPGNRQVVHHAIVFVRPPEGERQAGIGWLTAFVPGQSFTSLPPGTARRIPRGSKLVFQMHYTPIGVETTDLTKVSLVFADEASIHTELQTRIVLNREFEIPPQARDYEVQMEIGRFPPQSRLWAISPHMHYRGKSFRVSAENENAAKTLLSVPNYDFHWQHLYVLEDPLPLDGVTIHCSATFDNSDQNLVNPDPNATVRWGDQTWDEMAMAYLAILVPREETSQTPVRQRPSVVSERREKRLLTMPEREAQANEVARQFFSRLDGNRDGRIARGETSPTFRAFAWKTFDKNDDDELSWEEVLMQARLSLRP